MLKQTELEALRVKLRETIDRAEPHLLITCMELAHLLGDLERERNKALDWYTTYVAQCRELIRQGHTDEEGKHIMIHKANP